MSKKVLIFIMIVLSLCSCGNKLEQAKRVAEKGLKELGSGKYAGEYYLGKYFNFDILYLFDSPFFAIMKSKTGKQSVL